MRIARKYLAPFFLLLISTMGAAYAATTLFTQTFPAIPATPTTITGCATLTPNTSSVVAGSTGFIEFDCSGTSPFGTTPAVTSTTNQSPTPQFTLPSGYTSLFLYNLPFGANNCAAGVHVEQITSGSAVNNPPFGVGSDDYCANYSNAPSTGLAAFTVTWSQ